MMLRFFCIIALILCNYRVFHAQGDRRFNALKSLIIKNSKASIHLDSDGLAKLMKLVAGKQEHKERSHEVGFSVYPSTFLKVLGKDQNIVFDRVLTNEGGGYNKLTGMFVCPEPGLYSSTVDAMALGGVWWYIQVNGNIAGGVHIPANDNHWNQVSRTIIVKLKKGDHVNVRNNASVNVHPHYTGFSGVLISRDV